MARPTRLAVAGELHYVIQRGHNHQNVFADDQDREAYLLMLRDAASRYRVPIHAYALLPSEVHLMVTPTADASLGRLMQSLGRRYVAAYNRRHGHFGTLWAGRYRAGVIDSIAFGLEALVHVESLCVRAGLTASAAEWPWSSAGHHLGRRRDPLVSEHPAYWALGNTPFERELAHAHKLADTLSPSLIKGIEAAAAQSRAFGSASFCNRIAIASGMNMSRKPRGRPRVKVITAMD